MSITIFKAITYTVNTVLGLTFSNYDGHDALRSSFSSLTIPFLPKKKVPNPNHQNTVERYFELTRLFCNLNGLTPYTLSGPFNPVSNEDILPNESSVISTDDSNLSRINFLFNTELPITLLAFQPDSIAGVTSEYHYYPVERNLIRQAFNNGETYDRPLLDLNQAYYYTESWTLSAWKWLLALSIPAAYYVPLSSLITIPLLYKTMPSVVVRSLTVKKVAPNYVTAFFNPISKVNAFGLIVGVLVNGYKPLKPLRFQNGDWCTLNHLNDGVPTVSIARVGKLAFARLPLQRLQYLEDIAKSVTKMRYTTICSNHNAIWPNQPIDEAQAGTIDAYFVDEGVSSEAIIRPVDPYVHRYQVPPFDPFTKPKVVSYMPPIIDGAFSGDENRATLAHALQERIVKPQEHVKGLEVTQFIVDAMIAFNERFIPTPGVLVPDCPDEVYSKQPRPSQRPKLDNGFSTITLRKLVRVFIKAQAEAKIKPLRLISELDDSIRAVYSTIIYPMMKLLIAQPWYAGRRPREVADTVATIAHTAQFLNCSDFTVMDGHFGKAVRQLILMVLLRAFHPKYHPIIRKVYAANYNSDAVLSRTQRLKYSTLLAQLSGSLDTNFADTIANAFVTFVARLLTNQTYDEAWRSLNNKSVLMGDDGLHADLPMSEHDEAASMLGFTMKFSLFNRGESGANFLSRIYGPEVWYGCPDSMQDEPRALKKIHTVVPNNFTPWENLLHKSCGYFLCTNPTTPLGKYCAKVVKVAGLSPSEIEDIVTSDKVSWALRVSKEEQYPSTSAAWTQDYFNKQLPNFDIAAFDRYLDQADTQEKLLSMPCFSPLDPKLLTGNYLVDEGITFRPASPSVTLPANTSKSRKRRERRKRTKLASSKGKEKEC